MLVIGIAGGTGSGKTTVVNKILQQLNIEGVNVLSQDNYYHDNPNLTLSEREVLNYDHPKSIDFDLMLQHVKALKNHQSIEQPIYSFVTHSRTGDHVTVEPKNVLIVEGILVLTNKELLKDKKLISGLSEEIILNHPELVTPKILDFNKNFHSPEIDAPKLEKEMMFSFLQKNFASDLRKFKLTFKNDNWELKTDDFYDNYHTLTEIKQSLQNLINIDNLS